MHGPSSSSFQFLSFSNSFPKLTIFTIYVSTWLSRCGKITALTWEISSWRLVEKFDISAFPMYYSLYNWIREHEITKLKKKHLLWMQKKDTKTSKKHMNEMEWHKMDYLIFSEMRMRKRHLFCTSSHHNVSYEKQQEVNRGSEPWNESPCKSACAVVKYALH